MREKKKKGAEVTKKGNCNKGNRREVHGKTQEEWLLDLHHTTIH